MISHLLLLAAPSGDSVIRGKTPDSEIVITTTTRCAGAIHSLTWRGKEFINSYDHGRQLQSASNFDAGSPITAETFNPTEAGSRRDDVGFTSTSRLLDLSAKGNELNTKSLMAFWLAPGERSGPHLAKNKTLLSNHGLEKRIVIGYRGRPQIISYDVAFTLPKDEAHGHAVFESLTGYMPPEFSQFWNFDSRFRELAPLSDGPGEQPHPVILATPNGSHAMGIFSPEKQAKGYGRWRFVSEKVVKWNCVFRVDNPAPGGRFAYRHFVLVGTLDQVKRDMSWLSAQAW